MTLPPVIRIFFAIELPPFAKEALGCYIAALKKKSKSNHIRWTKPENLHLTLQFLPEVRTEHLTTLIENVRKKIEGSIKNSTITFGALHLFPNPYRPRVIVLEIEQQDYLANISQLMGEGIKASHYDIENRPFRAHLTLGRIKQPRGVDLSFLSMASKPEMGEMEIKEAILFRSEPQPEGSKYTVLERIGFICQA